MPSYFRAKIPIPAPVRERQAEFLRLIPDEYPDVMWELESLLPLAQTAYATDAMWLDRRKRLDEILAPFPELRAALSYWAEKYGLTVEWAQLDVLHTLRIWTRNDGPVTAFAPWETRYTEGAQFERTLRRIRAEIAAREPDTEPADHPLPPLHKQIEAMHMRHEQERPESGPMPVHVDLQLGFEPNISDYRRAAIYDYGLEPSPRSIDRLHLKWLVHYQVGNFQFAEIAGERESGEPIRRAAKKAAKVRVGGQSIPWISLRRHRAGPIRQMRRPRGWPNFTRL